MKKNDIILITGASGMLGSSFLKACKKKGYKNIFAPTSSELNLLDKDNVNNYFQIKKPQYVFHLAGMAYGIFANLKYQADIFYKNLCMNTNIIEASRKYKVNKITVAGSIAVYPKNFFFLNKTLKEDYVFYGEPHESVSSYSYAKRTMLSQLEVYKIDGLDFCYVIFSKIYGPKDNFNLETCGVVAALIRKFYEASISGNPVTILGNENIKRDIVYVDDASNFLFFAMKFFSGRVNFASGKMISLKNLASSLGKISGIKNNFYFLNNNNEIGSSFHRINISKLKKIKFNFKTPVFLGLKKTYIWYTKNFKLLKKL